MAPQRVESPSTPLGQCEHWPTALLLTPTAIRLLDELVRRATDMRIGVPIARAEIVSGLVLECRLTRPEDLLALSHGPGRRAFAAADRPPSPLAAVAHARLFVRLPSPVTWRLQRMVQRAQLTGERATRAGIVTGLLHTAPQDDAALRKLAERARTRLAATAVLDGDDPITVLTMQRPLPGPVARRPNQRPPSPRSRRSSAAPK
jgi:hypothetical protein